MEEKEQDRSEQPTVFKLTRAREKGMVARGMDLGFLTGLATFLGFAWIAGPGFASALSRSMHDAVVSGPILADGNSALLSIVGMLFSSVMPLVVLMAGAVFAVVLLFEIVQTGLVFSGQPLKPDFSRLNPANGLKRLFSLRLLLETLKNILKLSVYVTIGYLITHGALQRDIGSISDGESLAATIPHVALRLVAGCVLGALVFATLDQIIARRDFLKRMRMSRREVRRESRDREGDPRLKQKRKQLHREFTKTSKSLRNVRKADVLITNPEHIAIGLRYDAQTMSAPLVVSIGTNQLAQRLKRLAFLFGVPVVENRLLARELHRRSGLEGPVPERCFRAVAAIYNELRRERQRTEVRADA